jgi:hypothetical protein
MIYQPKAALVAWWRRQAHWMVPGLTTVVAAVAIASLAPGVALASGQYVLKHPTREHCRRNYVRDTKTVRIKGRRVRQVWCIHHAQQPAASKEAPAGSLAWLLAHTSVAHVSEVLSREAAPVFAEWSIKRREDQGHWVETAPECTTGSGYDEGYIDCEKKGELTYITEQKRESPCPERGREGEYCPEPPDIYQHAEKYRAILTVGANGGPGLCGDLTFQYFLGSQWESAQASHATCNVKM